jgi:hypothetical protein
MHRTHSDTARLSVGEKTRAVVARVAVADYTRLAVVTRSNGSLKASSDQRTGKVQTRALAAWVLLSANDFPGQVQ